MVCEIYLNKPVKDQKRSVFMTYYKVSPLNSEQTPVTGKLRDLWYLLQHRMLSEK